MTGPDIDYAAAYRQLPLPVLLLTRQFVVADVNQAYLDATDRSRDELVGHDVFAAFPNNPADPHASAVQDCKASLTRVLETGKPEECSFQKYDVEVHGHPGEYAVRYWNSLNAPVFGPDGQIVLIAHCMEEITHRVDRFLEGLKSEEAGESAD